MRYINLLEFQPHMTGDITPPSSYLEKTNGTLHPEPCALLVDGNGMMVTPRAATPDDLRVLLLGGSSIESLYIPASRKIGARIEEFLGASGHPVKVYNAAHSGAHLLHIINTLLNVGIGLRPHVVMYFPTPGADSECNEAENTFWHPGTNATTIRKLKAPPAPFVPDAFADRNGFADEARLLRVLYAICRNFGITLLSSTWPVYGPYDDFLERIGIDRALFEQADVQTARLNALVRAIAAEHGGALVDLDAAYAGLDRKQHFYDWNHPNILGCETIAQLAVSALLAAR